MPNVVASFRRSGAWLLPAVVSICVALGVGFDLHERFFTPGVQNATKHYLDFDSEIVSAAQGDGIFLRFANFPPALAWMGLDFYSRAVYSAYPRRVLASDPRTPIFDFDQLQAANFDPDALWLLHNQTPVEASYLYDPATGNISLTVQRVAAGPPRAR
jgi:hypothetical protein